MSMFIWSNYYYTTEVQENFPMESELYIFLTE
jgi:hypothetical protein